MTGLAFTVTLQVAVASPLVAVMVAVPAPIAVTRPREFTSATLSSEDDHVTPESSEVVASRVSVSPTVMVRVVSLRVMVTLPPSPHATRPTAMHTARTTETMAIAIFLMFPPLYNEIYRLPSPAHGSFDRIYA